MDDHEPRFLNSLVPRFLNSLVNSARPWTARVLRTDGRAPSRPATCLPAYGAKYGSVVRTEQVEGLGDEAWRLWAHDNGRQVTYHWRRDILVTEVHVHCYARECPSDVDADVDAAARAWADAVDEQAHSLRK